MDLALRVGGGVNNEAAGGETHRERCSFAFSTRFALRRTTERFARRADSVEQIGLGAVAALGSLRPVEFDHQLAALGQEPGEPGALTVDAFDRPCPKPTASFSSIEEALATVRVGFGCGRLQHRHR